MKTRLQAAAELLQAGRLADAKPKLLKELRLSPDSAPALELLGAVVSGMGRHEEAIGHLRRAVSLAPSAPGPRLNLGTAQFAAGRFAEAADTLADAVRSWPDIAEGRLSYANALVALGKRKHAIQHYHAAIRLAPRQVGTCTSLAIALFGLGDREATCRACERLLALDPGSAVGQFLLAMSRQMLCDWEGYEPWAARFADFVARGQAVVGATFYSLLWSDDAHLHRRCAELETRLYAAHWRSVPSAAGLARSERRSGPIRVAYVSADFRSHPTTTLITGVVERHDRSRFEIVGISLGENDHSAPRQRLAAAFDRFLDLRESPADAITAAMRGMEVDIAVDLMGHTTQGRPGIFLNRSAPVQVSYLGFAGTAAIDGVDYLIADPFIAGGDIRRTAAEKLVILPDCYQCNDDRQPHPSDPPPARSSCGLPGEAFVFCSFNHVQKLTPQVFDLWMRILRDVPGSVLWLLGTGSTAERNLKSEAERRGVAPERLIFAGWVSHSDHLARNAVADLHLDTFPYNAHTTASDALWAGAPILTRAGASFASRVCGSLLTTIGVPELITESAEDYVALALRLAREKPMLADLRRRIAEGRSQSPLFRTERFCRNLERAYEAMIARCRAGQPPAEIDLRSLAP